VAEAITRHYTTYPHWWLSGLNLVDLDGDGQLDLFFAAHGAGRSLAMLGDGHGHFKVAEGSCARFVIKSLRSPRVVRRLKLQTESGFDEMRDSPCMNRLLELWRAGSTAAYGQLFDPEVIERFSPNELVRSVSVYAKLIEQRIIFLGDPIYPIFANTIVCKLLYLQTQNDKAPIQIFINSPGGDVQSGLAIYDAMQYVKCPVSTICVGLAASMAAVLLSAGRKGMRYCLPNARVMIHQPWTSGIGGTVSDVLIEAEELKRTREKLNDIVARHTGKTMADVEKATDRNKWLSPAEAKDFGLVDDLTGLPPEPPAGKL